MGRFISLVASVVGIGHHWPSGTQKFFPWRIFCRSHRDFMTAVELLCPAHCVEHNGKRTFEKFKTNSESGSGCTLSAFPRRRCAVWFALARGISASPLSPEIYLESEPILASTYYLLRPNLRPLVEIFERLSLSLDSAFSLVGV